MINKKTFGFEKNWDTIAAELLIGKKKPYKVIFRESFNVHFFTEEELVRYKQITSSVKEIEEISIAEVEILIRKYRFSTKLGVKGIIEEYRKLLIKP